MVVIHIFQNSTYLNTEQAKNFPLMLTRACIDPFSKHQSQLFGIFKLDQILIIIYSSSHVYFNIYLHKFLKKQNEQNISQALEAYKKKKVREEFKTRKRILRLRMTNHFFYKSLRNKTLNYNTF